jgi:hypothetical protein
MACTVCRLLTVAGCAASLIGLAPRADAATLTGSTWSTSKTTVSAAGTGYTYAFTAATSSSLSSVTMTVPTGTAGTPAVGTVSPGSLAGGSVALAGTTLTYSFTSVLVLPATAVSIQINGLTNTSTAGSYTSEIVTQTLGTAVDSGVTPAVSVTGPLTLTSPASLGWAATLNGNNQSVTDTVLGDQQLTANDATGTGAGWHITVSATTFTNGTHTLADTGTFVVTGSISSAAASSAPTSSCVTSCTPPGDTTTYPVAITTASSSPPAANIYDAAAGSGSGAITLGGHSAADPVGWWVNVPANAMAGAYTSTVTLAVVSGP